MNQQTAELCREFQLPASALSLEVTPHLPAIDTGPITLHEDTLGTIFTMILSLVIATVLGGGGTALLMHGPLGWVLGLAIGLVVASIGKEAVIEEVKRREIPTLLRGVMISESKIEAKCQEMIPQLEKHVAERLAADTAFTADLAGKIRSMIEATLLARAEEALVFIP